jgi:phosphonate transport system substrate-binding protein
MFGAGRLFHSERALGLARESARSIFDEASAEPDRDRQKAIASWAMKSQSRDRITSALYLARTDLALERAGRAHVAFMGSLATLLAHEVAGARPILGEIQRGKPYYRSQYYVRSHSEIATLADLAGRSVAFTDPNSTTGFLFPAQQLADLGIDYERDVQPIFVGSHDASVAAVRRGDVDFGVAYEDARRMLRAQHPDVAERVIVFNHSEYIPNDGVQVRTDLPEDLKQAVARAFLEFAEEQAATLPREQRALYIIYEIDGFVPAEVGVYDTVSAVYELMRR